MQHIRKAWRKTPSSVRKTIIFTIGWIVVLIGIVDLPLPGPGWVIIFLGFTILATEFAHAKRTQDWLVARLKQVVAWAQKLWQKITRKS